METIREELARLVRQEAVLKLVLEDGLAAEHASDTRIVLLTVQARIAYLRNVLALERMAAVV